MQMKIDLKAKKTAPIGAVEEGGKLMLMSDQSSIKALEAFEMDFCGKPQADTEYRTRIYGRNRLERTGDDRSM